MIWTFFLLFPFLSLFIYIFLFADDKLMLRCLISSVFFLLYFLFLETIDRVYETGFGKWKEINTMNQRLYNAIIGEQLHGETKLAPNPHRKRTTAQRVERRLCLCCCLHVCV